MGCYRPFFRDTPVEQILRTLLCVIYYLYNSTCIYSKFRNKNWSYLTVCYYGKYIRPRKNNNLLIVTCLLLFSALLLFLVI